MNIFFSASSDVSIEIKNEYKGIMKILSDAGYLVSQSLFDGISNKKLIDENDFNFVYDDVLKKIDEAEVLLADISYPSSGVGYQVYHAVFQRKPVVIIYKKDGKTNPSVIIRGIKSKKVTIIGYENCEDLKKSLLEAVEKASGKVKVRFNLVMKASDFSFIERESKKNGQTKTGYLLGLLKKAKIESAS
jgi:hypothetical protein